MRSEIDMVIFQEMVRKALQESLNENYKVTCVLQQKNNGINFYGLQIEKVGENIRPILYLDDWKNFYEDGLPLEKVVGRLKEEIMKIGFPQTNIRGFLDELMMDYEKVKNQLGCRLICTKANEDFLKKVPHVPFLDLSVVFHISCNGIMGADASITIREDLRKLWNISTETLFADAISNMEPPVIENIIDMLTSDMEPEEKEALESILPDRKEVSLHVLDMYIMTNKNKCYGAAAMLYPGAFKKLSDELESDLMIFPSSIHELVMIPHLADSSGMSITDAAEIVRSVNKDMVAKESQLSNSVYLYHRENDSITLAWEGNAI